jgi:hypothetical protein
MRVTMLLPIVAIALPGLVGCEPPTVTIRHEFASPVGTPADLRPARAAPLEVVEGPADGYGKHASDHFAAAYGPSTLTAAGTVGGRLFIKVDNTEGTRVIRNLADDGTMSEQTIPTLVRGVELRAEFTWDARQGHPVTVEVRRRYNSTADPDVRGEYGLYRVDDPDRVPATDAIIRRLIEAAVEEFVGMIRPITHEAKVQLEPVKGPAAKKAFDLAEEGEYQLAAAGFGFVEGPSAKFNSAVMTEAACDYAEALRLYSHVVEDTPSDEDNQLHVAAKQGVARCNRAVNP